MSKQPALTPRAGCLRLFSQTIHFILTITDAQLYNSYDLRASQGGLLKMTSVWCLLIAGGTMGTIALIGFLWGVKNGAFENAEDAKYIVFRDEEDD